GSGSVLIDALLSTFSQCVPGTGNTAYYFGYRFKASGGPDAAGTATCHASFVLSGDPCDESTGGDTAAQQYNTDTWIQGSGSATSPSGTAMVRIGCAGAAAAGYYDQLYLSTTSPGTPAF